MDEIDRRLLVQTEKGIPLTPHPFDQIAQEIGISPQEAIDRLQRLQKSGIIRRFGISLVPNGVGYLANALVAWKVPPQQIASVNEYFCKCKEVSHCYERGAMPGKWDYNFYTVIHAPHRSAVKETVQRFAAELSLREYVILFSTRNLKLKEKTKC